MNILDNFKSLFFCNHNFGVRRSIDVLDSGNQPGSGSGALRFTEDVWHQKYEKKEDFQNYLEYLINKILKIFFFVFILLVSDLPCKLWSPGYGPDFTGFGI